MSKDEEYDRHRPSHIITNDAKDAVIARILERTEWMIEESKRNGRVIERLDQTLDHVSEAVSKTSTTLEQLAKAVAEQETLKNRFSELETRLALIEPQIKFWETVRDRIFWIGLVVLLAVLGAGYSAGRYASDEARTAIQRALPGAQD